MADHRYNFKDVPGPTTTVSFRVPETAALILDELILELEDVKDRSAAMQDAFVKWVMLEEHARMKRQAAEPPPASE